MLCPISKVDCVGKDCAMSTTLFSKDEKGERVTQIQCSFSWIPVVILELKDELVKFNNIWEAIIKNVIKK